MINKPAGSKGIIKTLLLIIIVVALLAYYQIDLRQIITEIQAKIVSLGEKILSWLN